MKTSRNDDEEKRITVAPSGYGKDTGLAICVVVSVIVPILLLH